MALNSLECADVFLSIYSLSQISSISNYCIIVCVFAYSHKPTAVHYDGTAEDLCARNQGTAQRTSGTAAVDRHKIWWGRGDNGSAARWHHPAVFVT